jgi:NADH dehydrogenase (ubiquinone) 1 alpha subcomplex subunit 11
MCSFNDKRMFYLCLAIAGVVKKMSIEEGWEFFPDIKVHGYGGPFPNRHDYSLMAERERGWTDGKNK